MIDCQLMETNRYSFLQRMHIRICPTYFFVKFSATLFVVYVLDILNQFDPIKIKKLFTIIFLSA